LFSLDISAACCSTSRRCSAVASADSRLNACATKR
jgi:hypothetical protein